METNIHDFQIRVLVSMDNGKFVANALEMDLVAYGKTEKEAIRELTNLIRNQISFAMEKREDHLMYFRAPDVYFEEWEKAHAAALQGMVAPGKFTTIHMKARSICFSHRDLKELRKLSRSQRLELNPLACA